ncbi:YhcN/YlaJ family sporulation lipoprotein [Sporosarcina sp. 179-K 3D1 HS]|uniref:YhcN/YlaJ family sporulation lipoprotein n=1 Tax=Sporosarcina sp. 179-K 3D1 HS TaxID=3232169 RepID=UPI0039A20E0C
MKKWIQLTIAFLMVLSLIGCGMKKNNDASSSQATNTTQTQENNEVGTGEHAQGDSTNHNGHDNQSRLEVADEAAARVSDMKEVDNATVLVTDQNAYVAAVLTDQSATDLTSELESRIAATVREVDRDIENVYVSVNPDFVERLNEYGAKINEGQPVEGLFEEFTEVVQRVFPNAQ